MQLHVQIYRGFVGERKMVLGCKFACSHVVDDTGSGIFGVL